MSPNHKGVTAIIPSSRGLDNPALYAVLISIVNQSQPPSRVILADNTGRLELTNNQTLSRFRDHFHIELVNAAHPHTTAASINALIENCNTEWVWIVPDDLAPAYDCLEKLYKAAILYDADLVSGVKLDVIRRGPWGEDWNRMNHPHRGTIVMPWADTANLLIKREVWEKVDTNYDPGFGINGEDVVTTAQIGQDYQIVGCGEAIGWHIPADDHRWNTSDGDSQSIKILSEKLTEQHMEWFKRFITRSK